MGKNTMNLAFLSKPNSDPKPPPYPWQWPSCGHIKTLSFRATAAKDDIFKTLNSAYLESTIDNTAAETPHSCFTNSCAESSRSFSTMSEESGSDQIEMMIRGLRSERLFFEPGETNSILEAANKTGKFSSVPYKESVVLSMESKDPFADFRRSMEEMIEAHGLKDWERLEELLGWYLRVNGKNNHGYIISAFIDLLVSLSFAPSTSSPPLGAGAAAAAAASSSSSSSSLSYSPSSPLSLPSSSSLTTPCLSSSDVGHDDYENDEVSHGSS
ncbi:hypothetical protein Nepgr_011822 [Nepenthes gracilis]|uniref:Transcription repressor n=1 Tax=Nepenthes gracilis TaxID=150966 RepID=A0AAD3SFT4_NEPGR|nr:hypothetical protein Nepgr_011822 [Nepenthes gracilis]